MKEGWTYKKLGEVCEIIGGGTPSKNNVEYYSGSIPWATVRDMNCDILSSTEYFISETALKDSSSHLIPSGEIIIATRVGLGKVCKLAQDTAINQDLKAVVPKKNDINRKFLFYYFKRNTQKFIDNGVGATVKGVKIKFVEEQRFPVPSLSEQQAIVSRLDSAFAQIDALKANAEKQLEEARKLFQAELTEAMKPKEGWEEKRMKDVYDVRDGTHDSPKYHETGYPLVTSKNLRGGILDMSNVSLISEVDYRAINNRSKVDVGDVLFAMIGTIGNPVYVQVEPHYAIKNMALFKVPSNQSGEFLKYYLLNEDVLLKMQTESKGTTQKFVSLGYLRNFLITIPPLSTQHQIVSRLDALSANVKRLEELQQKTLAECDALKQAMLREVFE